MINTVFTLINLDILYFSVFLVQVLYYCCFYLQVESSDRSALNKLVETVKTNYNERAEEIKKHWGGSSLGNKSTARINKQNKAKSAELTAKA